MAQDQKIKPLPNYDNPPVIEVVCGIQFEPLGLTSPGIALFWQIVRNEYPKIVENPPLLPIIEEFNGKRGSEPEINLTGNIPVPRLWFVEPLENWLIQLQNDRFLHNWKKAKEEDVYPRFDAVYNKFFLMWTKFQEFCQAENVPTPTINQLELTYINHIVGTNVKSYVRDATNFFPDMRWRDKHEFLPDPEILTWKTAFLLPERQGRLHVTMRPAVRKKDQAPVLLLELTARGMPKGKDPQTLQGWFQMGREWIVRGFADLTDIEVQKKFWGRKA